jgi:hypothetical protein
MCFLAVSGTKARGSAGRTTSVLTRRAEQSAAADALQRTLVPRFRFRARLSASVAMIGIANGCAKRIYKSDFWRKRCVNHHYFLMCT